MLSLFLAACMAPTLYEASSPLINPGEREPALYYEGPGILLSGYCDGPGLDLTTEPLGMWPVPLLEDELAEVWVEAAPDAEGGEWLCSVMAGDLVHEVSVMVVVL